MRHLNRGLDYFSAAVQHAQQAEDETYDKAGALFDKGNQELRESIDEYSGGEYESAWKHYYKALDKYDQALDLIE